jgi:glycine/D-amino acid oxidase-like deaminating enzyme
MGDVGLEDDERAMRDAEPSRAAWESGTVPIERSGWRPPEPLPLHAPLEGDALAEVAVVGAGLAGSALALGLAEARVDAVLLEAGQPANGASGRNAGHVEPFLGSLAPLARWPDGGRRFLEHFVQSRDVVFQLCAKHGIDADAEKCGVLEVARRPSDGLRHHAERWRALGYEVEVAEGARVRELCGSERYRFALHWREGGRVNPYLFTRGMAAAAARLGARVHGESPVVACERQGSRWRLATPRGSVRARRVVLCTNGHAGNAFFPELARTQYPLVACTLATAPLSPRALAIVNPSRAAMTQHPTNLYPLILDGRRRLVTSTIPHPHRAHRGDLYFGYFLRFLHGAYPELRGERIELESYWTGMTSQSSSVYREDYPQLFEVDDGVLALLNLGTWGNALGPILGLDLARALADERPGACMLPMQRPARVGFPRLFELKIRYLLVPAARVVDRLGLA